MDIKFTAATLFIPKERSRTGDCCRPGVKDAGSVFRVLFSMMSILWFFVFRYDLFHLTNAFIFFSAMPSTHHHANLSYFVPVVLRN
jgi:hypothetical protein